MPSKLTALGMSVLATLTERPMHPYEVYQLLVDRREEWLVKVRPGSLYHTVERLADDGLLEATGTDRTGKRPERTTYSITPHGRNELKERIAEIVRTPEYEYPVFPVALSELHEIPMSDAIDHLQSRVELLEAKQVEIDAVIAQIRAQGVLEAYWFTADYLRCQLMSERDWIRGLIDRLKNGEMEWPKEGL